MLAESMTQFERELIEHALWRYSGRRAETAKYLGITRKCLWQKMKRHKLLTNNKGSVK